jgi:LuxR family transcriptional regulator, regulator of acetate metabolism
MSGPDTDPRGVAAALRELRQIQRELTERDLVRRADAHDEVQEAIGELAEIGSSAAILERAAATLGRGSGFAQIVVSQVDGDRLVPRSFWARSETAPDLAERIGELEIVLRYPLIEAEVVQRGAEAIALDAAGPRSPAALRELLGWNSYVVVPLRLRERPIGLLHAEPVAAGALDLELEIAGIYAKGLADAFERAVLRETLQRHRDELRTAVGGIGEHLDERAPGIELGSATREPVHGGGEEQEKLTRRESEILKMMGGGRTNGAIATSLLISESTVKFHVKNILLKLGATSRADAVARHLRGGG